MPLFGASEFIAVSLFILLRYPDRLSSGLTMQAFAMFAGPRRCYFTYEPRSYEPRDLTRKERETVKEIAKYIRYLK